MSRRADNLETAQRVEVVYRAILAGYRTPRIVQFVTKNWGVKDRQGYRYVEIARQQVRVDAAHSREGALDEHLLARRELRRKSEDAWFILQVLRDEAKLLGLYPTARQENFNIDLDQLSDGELEQITRGETMINVLIGRINQNGK